MTRKYLIIGIAATLALVVGVTYAFFTYEVNYYEGSEVEFEYNFAARGRLDDNKMPSYACGANATGTGYIEGGTTANIADKFTWTNSDNIGNQLLGSTPAALMTADEIAFAGGIYDSSNSSAWYYLNGASTPDSITGETWWWTMSTFKSYGGEPDVFDVGGSGFPGYLCGNVVTDSYGVLPVIFLKSTVQMTGTGTASDSYVVVSLN